MKTNENASKRYTRNRANQFNNELKNNKINVTYKNYVSKTILSNLGRIDTCVRVYSIAHQDIIMSIFIFQDQIPRFLDKECIRCLEFRIIFNLATYASIFSPLLKDS